MTLAPRDADHSILLRTTSDREPRWREAIAEALGGRATQRIWRVEDADLDTALHTCLYRATQSDEGDRSGSLEFVLVDLTDEQDLQRLRILSPVMDAHPSASFIVTTPATIDHAEVYRTLTHTKGMILPDALDAGSIARALRTLSIAHDGGSRPQDTESTKVSVHTETPDLPPAHSRDCLTELYNRRGFLARLENSLRLRKARPSHQAVVMFLDLDDFKGINDSLGHEVGDMVLRVVADRLRGCLRSVRTEPTLPDTLGRLGGDEFAMLLEGVRDADEAVAIAERMQECFAEPIGVRGHRIDLGTSVGVALIRRDHTRPEHVLRDADIAMYSAKRGGKGDFAIFDESLQRDMSLQADMERDLRDAMARGEFSLQYQPIVRAENGETVSVEALLRWRHPTEGLIAPSEFIEVADNSGVLTDMTDWILTESMRQMRQWRDAHAWGDQMMLSVNLSRRQLIHPDFYDMLFQSLATHDLRPDQLCLEFKEGALTHRSGASVDLLQQVQARGVKLAVDDFGAGASSLGTLGNLSLDAIKIDRSCTDLINGGGTRIALIDAILTMARRLEIDTIAGGVAENEQLATLLAMGCPRLQGYLIAEPLEPDEVGRFVDQGARGWNSAA